MKKHKPISEAQKVARERNWNKCQIMGMKSISQKLLISKRTKNSEKEVIKMIISCLDNIIKDWNK